MDRHGIAICGAGDDGGDVLGHAVSFFGRGDACCLRVRFGGGRRRYLIALASAQIGVAANVPIYVQLGRPPRPEVAQMARSHTCATGLMTTEVTSATIVKAASQRRMHQTDGNTGLP